MTNVTENIIPFTDKNPILLLPFAFEYFMKPVCSLLLCYNSSRFPNLAIKHDYHTKVWKYFQPHSCIDIAGQSQHNIQEWFVWHSNILLAKNSADFWGSVEPFPLSDRDFNLIRYPWELYELPWYDSPTNLSILLKWQIPEVSDINLVIITLIELVWQGQLLQQV